MSSWSAAALVAQARVELGSNAAISAPPSPSAGVRPRNVRSSADEEPADAAAGTARRMERPRRPASRFMAANLWRRHLLACIWVVKGTVTPLTSRSHDLLPSFTAPSEPDRHDWRRW